MAIRRRGGGPIFRTTAKPAVKAEYRASGRSYALIWNNDLPAVFELRNELKTEVAKLSAFVSAELITAEDLERMAKVHPAVIRRFGGPPSFGQPIDRWARASQFDTILFKADQGRLELLDAIQDFASSSATRSVLHVFGDTGVRSHGWSSRRSRKADLKSARLSSPTRAPLTVRH
jgi:hypothetical protein